MAAKKQASWGGARPGAGRPKGSGSGPSPNSRMNRVAIMLTDADMSKLVRIARRKNAPVATLAYEMMAKGLSKAR